MREALIVACLLYQSSLAFKRGEQQRGWMLLEEAEQRLPSIDNAESFANALVAANAIWSSQGATFRRETREIVMVAR